MASVTAMLEYLLLLWTACLGFTYAQTCTQVFTERSHCDSMGDVEITCPPGYLVTIIEASIRVLREPGCSTSQEAARDACKIEALTSYVANNVCFNTQSCIVQNTLFDVSYDACSAYLGENILSYKYRCKEVSQLDQSICAASRHGLSNIRLGPNLRVFEGVVGHSMITDTECACSVTLPANTELTVWRELFIVKPYMFTCDQRVLVHDGGTGAVLAYVCITAQAMQVIPCADRDRVLYFTYETLDHSILATFNIEVYTAHTGYMEVQCGVQYNPTTIGPTTPAPPKKKKVPTATLR